jgi:hypothetical protein
MNVVELRQAIESKLKALKNQNEEYKTPCVFIILQGTVNIKTLGRERLVDIVTKLMYRKQAQDFLGIETTMNGLPIDDILADCKTRLNIIERGKQIRKLETALEETRNLLDDAELKALEVARQLEQLNGII